jgi:transcriptional accessory protein Tex/SPT6
MVLQKVIKDSHIQTSGQTFTKSILLIGHAADVAFIARTRRELVERFCSLGESAEGTGLRINQTYTQYMRMNTKRISVTNRANWDSDNIL